MFQEQQEQEVSQESSPCGRRYIFMPNQGINEIFTEDQQFTVLIKRRINECKLALLGPTVSKFCSKAGLCPQTNPKVFRKLNTFIATALSHKKDFRQIIQSIDFYQKKKGRNFPKKTEYQAYVESKTILQSCIQNNTINDMKKICNNLDSSVTCALQLKHNDRWMYLFFYQNVNVFKPLISVFFNGRSFHIECELSQFILKQQKKKKQIFPQSTQPKMQKDEIAPSPSPNDMKNIEDENDESEKQLDSFSDEYIDDDAIF